jgi:hypothetical protein
MFVLVLLFQLFSSLELGLNCSFKKLIFHYFYGRHGIAGRPYMRLLCVRGRGFRRIAALLCNGADND